MSLLDFWRLIRKNWVKILLIALLCAAAGFAYELYKSFRGTDSKEQAITRVVANSQTAAMTSLADAEARLLLDPENEEDAKYKISFYVPSGQTTLQIKATGPDADRCIYLANTVATNTAEKAEDFFAGLENPWTGYAELTDKVKEKESTAKLSIKYVAVGLIAGLFLALCVLLLLDLKKRSVKSLQGMQDLVQLPVLEKLPAANGERLLANVRFAAKEDDIAKVCVVPLSDASPAAEVCSLLETAVAAEGSGATFTTQPCKPLSAGMEAAYQARDAAAALVVAKQWDDSLTDLETTVAELQLAGANIAGLVYAE